MCHSPLSTPHFSPGPPRGAVAWGPPLCAAMLRLVAAGGVVPGERQQPRHGGQDRGAPGGEEGRAEPEKAAGADDPMLPMEKHPWWRLGCDYSVDVE